MNIRVTILKFERIDQEEYKTKTYSKDFYSSHTLWHINEWIKSIDPKKDISDAYFEIIES